MNNFKSNYNNELKRDLENLKKLVSYQNTEIDSLKQRITKLLDPMIKFDDSRIRKVIGWEDPPQFTDIWRAYRTWTADENPTGKKLTQNELKIRLNMIYQVSTDGKTYKNIRLFFSEEEIEKFDKENAEEDV
jgi:hypothetical protein